MPTAPNTQDNAAQIAYWNDRAAVTWTAFQERLDAVFEPLTALALDAAAPAANGMAVPGGRPRRPRRIVLSSVAPAITGNAT